MRRITAPLLALMVGISSGLAGSVEKAGGDPWSILKDIVVIPGVSGFEGPVADFVVSRLPTGIEIQRDDMDNLWFTVGQGRPHLLFVAHTDELGLVIESITAEGKLKVRGRGGFFPQMYEGRPVIIQTKSGEVNGIVSPRKDYFKRGETQAPSLDSLEIYLGVSSEIEVRELGVLKGDSITINKTVVELSPDLLATRAVDDRAGCAALLAAAQCLDWTGIEGKTVTFAWDVQEEIGLLGASHLAETLDVDYVFPVDTFVSSDGPFDSPRFALTPLGKGPVVRAIDSSSIAPRQSIRKVLEIARKNGITVQLGNTRGGNDGSVFVPGGAVDIALSWPGTYSHSFIEKIHRRDLKSLTDLIVVITREW